MRFTGMNRMSLMTTSKPMNPMQSSASLRAPRATRMTAWAGMATLAALAMAPTGCYRHVVGTSGGAGAEKAITSCFQSGSTIRPDSIFCR